MIICICANVSNTRINQAIKNGVNTIDELSFELGVCAQCQCCQPQIEKMLSDAQANPP